MVQLPPLFGLRVITASRLGSAPIAGFDLNSASSLGGLENNMVTYSTLNGAICTRTMELQAAALLGFTIRVDGITRRRFPLLGKGWRLLSLVA
jgi:hypothetical protein